MDVSRETKLKLEDFCDLLLKWNKRINLISKASEDDVWQRHIEDSAQLYIVGGDGDHWADIGSGGGLPGIVLAIFASEYHPSRSFSLVESDQRKCAFLREAARICEVKVQVIAGRIEQIPALNADILSARALAPLSSLLEFSKLHRKPEGLCLFLKGARFEEEIAAARKTWHFDPIVHKSQTDAAGAIVEIRNVSNV